MTLTLVDTNNGTVPIFCPRCSVMLTAKLSDFKKENDYCYGVRCAHCKTAFVVRLPPLYEESESEQWP